MSNPALPNGANLLSGTAKVYFNRLDANGIASGERYLGDISELSFGTENQTIERYSHSTAARPLLKQVSIRRKPTFKIKLAEYTSWNLALGTLGDDGYFTQAGSTVTDEAIKSCVGDRWIKLANRNLASVTNVKKGATTYVVGTDYAVDLVQGRIYVIAGGAIDLLTHPDSLTSTYVLAAVTGVTQPKVTGATAAKIEGYFRIEGFPTAGHTFDIEIYKASVLPDGDLTGFITEEFGEFSLTCAILEDAAHPGVPYTVYQRVTASS